MENFEEIPKEIRQFEIRTRSSDYSKIGYWSAAIKEFRIQGSRRIAISGKIRYTELDDIEIVAAIQSIQKVPENSRIEFYTSCRYFHEGITQKIRETQNSSLWKELEKISKNYKIFWKLVPKGDINEKRNKKHREPTQSILDQRELAKNRTKISQSTPSQKQDWIQRYKNNESAKEIAFSAHVHHRTVVRELQRQKIYVNLKPGRLQTFNQERRDHWIQKYEEGKSPNEIALSEDLNKKTVIRELKRRNLYDPKRGTITDQERHILGGKAYNARIETLLPWPDIAEKIEAYQHHSTIRILAENYARIENLTWPIMGKRKYIRKNCKASQCNRKARAEGYCSLHYARFYKLKKGKSGKNLEDPVVERLVKAYPKDLVCSEEGCNRLVKTRFLCKQHYERLRTGAKITGNIRNRKPNRIQSRLSRRKKSATPTRKSLSNHRKNLK